MNLTGGEQAEIIGVGAVFILAFSGGIWRVATLRGDVGARWSERVGLAVAALDAKTFSRLEQLRGEVDELLPKDEFGNDVFDPAQAIADPTSLSESAAEAVKLQRSRNRMKSAIAGLRRVGRAVLVALAGALVGTAAATIYYGELWNATALKLIGWVLLGVSIASLIAVTIVYVVLLDWLATDEGLAGTAGHVESTNPPRP
jgi:hypothetical protein